MIPTRASPHAVGAFLALPQPPTLDTLDGQDSSSRNSPIEGR